ncbi:MULTISPECIES: hypoxanthine phosphoribosyltransferase [Weeksella]|uniref:Hypoxanthine phosphoribosyltransferase n=1 Tax=Weeksella virosa (strain ATCC 43766 / DSM 16922 / JCM 21250 / CCUG 30538 / CDC 9751 / IAM 14551 / NBRC 16016 / NCTC 11634 / CL345/78) TaxID=865938 RepID=F0NXZ4_WEEVC|nr:MULTISPECIES: hypoxanthine phosphoribosyltransferase [Weeksella]ADX68062.1 hypoxanthine phosphoribosyltransferase [Weeksella virosa DSM 16922]MDK7675401.1 hypoxanthine phosphoribosyltransferase [Weeksella virosa]OFM83854.1 hypoxanthine phosphoribosyltransferase [Weeksella sp. HMSC059D05]SUP54371.1 Hypoxanthine-guanine phosphoribosyltransferase [Weeksella virosa]VEH64305.1 Hypoxanthine-guanine phosphoribosyltransferase [Weeksella virosa]
MKEIEIHGKRFIPYIAFEEIEHAIIDMANKIYDEYKDEVPVFVGVLNGVVMFMSDFLKHYPGECEISFLKLSSYEGTETTGKVKIQMDIPISVEGRHVIILEDIVDTGNTLVELHKILTEKKVKSLKIATLLFKPDAYKKDLVVDLVGLSIPDKFVVGYGLDFDGFGRNLPDIYQIKS